jgi:hypothetical protein
MATDIGIIKTLIGTATATAPDGLQRTLKVGDRVSQDELISTGVLGAIEIEFTDGSIMTLGRNSQVMLNDETFNFAEPQQAESLQTSENADVESIQQAILDGDDPTQTTQATAAGAGVESSNEGIDFVQVNYEKPEMIPEAGFDTTGISFAFEEEFIDEGAIDDSNSLLANQLDDAPLAGTTILLLDEDDLSGIIASGYGDIDTAFELSTGKLATPATKKGNNDLSLGDDVDQNSSTILSGNLDIDFGDDGAGDITFNAGSTQPQGITSNGVEIEYWISEDGHTLIGFVPTGSNTVDVIFTAEITNAQTGAFTATLYGSVDHENTGSTIEENLAIDLGFTISDVDGDLAQGVLRFDIDDDVPSINFEKNDASDSVIILRESFENIRTANGWHIEGEGGGQIIGDHGIRWETNIAGVEYQRGRIGGSRASDGETHIELDAHDTLRDGGTTNSVLTTKIDLQDSNAIFEFDYKSRTKSDSSSVRVSLGDAVVEINGASGEINILSGTVAATSQPTVDGWTRIQLNYNDLSLGETNLSFEGIGAADSFGAYIDNVTFIADQALKQVTDHTEISVLAETIGQESISLGADNAGSINFTFSESDIFASGDITSNGKLVTFEVKDSNNDGFNDQIIGVTDDDTEVLSIDGILGGDFNLNILEAIDNHQDANVEITAHFSVEDGDGDTDYQDLTININVEVNDLIATAAITDF